MARGTVYQSVSPVVDWWIQLQVLLLVLFALLAFVVFVSLAGEHHATATTARQALVAIILPGVLWRPRAPALKLPGCVVVELLGEAAEV